MGPLLAVPCVAVRENILLLPQRKMDPFTHFLAGACLGRSGFNRKTAYATLAMTLAAEAPDLDVFWSLRGPVAGFEHHRGITHTLIAAPVIAVATLGCVWLVHRIRRKPPTITPRWGLIWLFALIADLSHLLLDFTNNYGLRPFFPFNPRWYAWDIVYIFEPLIFLGLLLALIMPWLLGLADKEIGSRRKPFRGRGWAIAALVFVVLVWAVRNAEHTHAIAVIKAADGITREPILRVAAEPYPINPFLWHMVIETRDYYQAATVHTRTDQIDTDAYEDTIYKPPVTPAAGAAKRSWLGRVYLDWSKYPVATDLGTLQPPGAGSPPPVPGWHTVEFEDLRFAYSPMSASPGAGSNTPLAGWVYVGPAQQIEEMFMSGYEQK